MVGYQAPEIIRAELDARLGNRRRTGERRTSSLAIMLRTRRERAAARSADR
jgi:hypothetical protein